MIICQFVVTYICNKIDNNI